MKLNQLTDVYIRQRVAVTHKKLLLQQVSYLPQTTTCHSLFAGVNQLDAPVARDIGMVKIISYLTASMPQTQYKRIVIGFSEMVHQTMH